MSAPILGFLEPDKMYNLETDVCRKVVQVVPSQEHGGKKYVIA